MQPSHPLSSPHPLLLPPSIFPSIRVFSNESVLRIRWPKYWSFSFNISPSNKYSGPISFRMNWLNLLAVQETLKTLLQHHDPWVRKIPWRRRWQPTPVFLPGESHGRRSLVGYSPRGGKELDMTERLHFHFHRHVRYCCKSLRIPGLKLEIWIRQKQGARAHFNMITIIQP